MPVLRCMASLRLVLRCVPATLLPISMPVLLLLWSRHRDGFFTLRPAGTLELEYQPSGRLLLVCRRAALFIAIPLASLVHVNGTRQYK